MSFYRPSTVKVEQKQLLRAQGLVEELSSHIIENGTDHSHHQEFINTRIQMLEELLREMRGLNRPRYEAVD